MASTQAPTRPSWDIASVASSSVDSRTTLEKPSMVRSFLPNERASVLAKKHFGNYCRLQDSPASQFPELQHQFEQILCGHRYRLRRPQAQPPLIACPRHEFRHGPLCGLHHIHWLFHHYVASFRMAATLPRITRTASQHLLLSAKVSKSLILGRAALDRE